MGNDPYCHRSGSLLHTGELVPRMVKGNHQLKRWGLEFFLPFVQKDTRLSPDNRSDGHRGFT